MKAKTKTAAEYDQKSLEQMGEPAAPKAKRKLKSKTATKKPTKPTEKAPAKKDAAARDKWGNREGTQAAVINAAIGSKPKSIAALAKETEIRDGRIRDHVRWLLARGFVSTSEAGIKAK